MLDTKEFDEKIDVADVDDWFVRLILKDQIVLQHRESGHAIIR